jgi:hypothetical protein
VAAADHRPKALPRPPSDPSAGLTGLSVGRHRTRRQARLGPTAGSPDPPAGSLGPSQTRSAGPVRLGRPGPPASGPGTVPGVSRRFPAFPRGVPGVFQPAARLVMSRHVGRPTLMRHDVAFGAGPPVRLGRSPGRHRSRSAAPARDPRRESRPGCLHAGAGKSTRLTESATPGRSDIGDWCSDAVLTVRFAGVCQRRFCPDSEAPRVDAVTKARPMRGG